MEPIANTGCAFKLPGGAYEEEYLWKMIDSKQNVSKEWPSSRLNIRSFYDESHRNQHCVRQVPASEGPI
jgi:acyl transferase domain-containing protein